MSTLAWWRRHAEVLASALLLLLYVVTAACMPKDVFWHPDEGGKFLAMQTIRWHGGLAYSVPYPGHVLDPTFEFYAGQCHEAHVYPQPELDGSVRFRWPIWFSLMSRPFFDALGIAGVYALPLLGGWLSAVVAGRWVTLAGSRLAPLAILLIGCGTPLFFYSLGFFEHTLATFAGVVALSILVSARARGWRTVLQMAPFLVVAVILRVEMLAFAVALVFTWAVSEAAPRFLFPRDDSSTRPRPRHWWSYVIAGGLAVVILVAVAGLLAPRQQQELRSLPELIGRNLKKWPYLISGTVHLLVGPSDLGPLSGTAGQLLLVLAIAGAVAAPFVSSRRTEAVLSLGALGVLLTSGLVTALASRPYLGRQGVLAVAPYIVIGLYVLPQAWRQRNHRLLRLAGAAAAYAVLGYLALFSTRVNEWGNELMGLDGCARYMLALYPAGVALSLVAIQTIRASDRPEWMKSAFTILVAAMVIVSCVYELRGLRDMRSNKLTLVAWQAALRGQDRVVTDIWWLPALLAPLSTTLEMYWIDEASRFPEWLTRARAHGATSFSFCTTRRIDMDRFPDGAGHPAPVGNQVVEGLHIYRFHLGE